MKRSPGPIYVAQGGSKTDVIPRRQYRSDLSCDRPWSFGLDGVKDIESLRGLGSSEARKALSQLRHFFFTAPAEAFEPYRR